MIVACEHCHRQIDVGAHAVGAKVRCFCGGLNVVSKRVARDAKMQKCSNCGAGLHASKPNCEYCTAPVSIPDRGLGPTCPSCFARLVTGAKYCSCCGLAIEAQAVLTALPSHRCPSCKGTLAECRSESIAFVECTACAGIWLDSVVFQKLIREATTTGESAIRLDSERRSAADQKPPDAPLYRACPVCKDIMPRRNYGKSGVIIDWCGRHGYWFDANELANILALARGGKLEKEAQRLHNEVERRKLPSGRNWYDGDRDSAWGWLSFLALSIFDS